MDDHMKHLIVQSVGPVDEADVFLKRINVVIGPQSLGKSTVLKLASYCTWVEKRIELKQSPDEFLKGDAFIRQLETFHKMQGYFRDESFISYESEYLFFSYCYSRNEFSFRWGKKRWEYHRPKISYIPAERNLVAAIPNWFELSLDRNNIRNFMTEWESARRSLSNQVPVLNLNVSYSFEKESKTDRVIIQNGDVLDLTNASSGLQSLIPLFVQMNYLYTGIYDSEKGRKIAGDWADEELAQILYKDLFVSKGRDKAVNAVEIVDANGKKIKFKIRVPKRYGSHSFYFSGKRDVQDFEAMLSQYSLTSHCEVFLEEPENSLFPPTQKQLVNWLYEMTMGYRENTLFIATHSPYVLSVLLEKNETDFAFFFNTVADGRVIVNTATEENCQTIFDNGIDAFFNIQNLAE
jgi:hypothetical protein